MMSKSLLLYIFYKRLIFVHCLNFSMDLTISYFLTLAFFKNILYVILSRKKIKPPILYNFIHQKNSFKPSREESIRISFIIVVHIHYHFFVFQKIYISCYLSDQLKKIKKHLILYDFFIPPENKFQPNRVPFCLRKFSPFFKSPKL